MQKKYEFLTRDEEVYLLTEETQTISLKEAVGTTAMCVYSNFLNLKEAIDSDEEKRLEEKILFQSKVLNSLSNAYRAIR